MESAVLLLFLGAIFARRNVFLVVPEGCCCAPVDLSMIFEGAQKFGGLHA